jgi:hypothetical protein
MYENNRGPEEYFDHKKELTFKRILPLIILLLLLILAFIYYVMNTERVERNAVSLDPEVNQIKDYISKHYISSLDELFNRKTAFESSNHNRTYEIAGMKFEEAFYRDTGYHSINSSIDSQQKIYTINNPNYEIFLYETDDELHIVGYTFDYQYLVEEEIK